ncbi:hypothetical protein [Acholeplasma equifetale]|uniref:hypothetical protein n=1 Tax=Acholeplasma equifetale TaxID=264634 RepID=UPI000479D775|nr:hypothetical protein [Acholeplasma equifetale]
MLSIQEYKKLQEYKELGLSKVKVSKKLNLSYKTICNWWDKDQAFFKTFQKNHEYVLDNYRQYIIEILKISPQINNTVLYKRIKDDFSEFDVQSSSFFKYVKEVREQTGLLKPKRKFQISKRIYICIRN